MSQRLAGLVWAFLGGPEVGSPLAVSISVCTGRGTGTPPSLQELLLLRGYPV